MPTIKEMLRSQQLQREHIAQGGRVAETQQMAEVVDLDSLDHDGLVELAASLKLGAPSTLRRWSDDRLRQEIADVSEKE